LHSLHILLEVSESVRKVYSDIVSEWTVLDDSIICDST
jgi:hypothetical protein